MTKLSPFRYFKTSLEVILLAVMLNVRFPLSLRNVEDLLHERSHVKRDHFKLNHTAIVAVWRQLCSA